MKNPISRRLLTKFAALAVVGALAAALCVPAMADTATDSGTGTVSSTIPITGNISSLVISVTHPISAAYQIDPNSSNPFTSPAIQITNNTTAPINVQIQSLTSASGGSLQFTDVLPTAKNWDFLNCEDSKKYIALGIKADTTSSGSNWNTGVSTAIDWAASAAPAIIGSLNAGTAGDLQLNAEFGRAFDASCTAMHSLVLEFSLV